MRQTITIKLKPYLQEYLLCHVNNPEMASKKNIIGALLTPFVEYLPAGKVCNIKKRKGCISFEAPQLLNNKNNRCTLYVSEKNQAEFERVLTIHFKDVFFNYIHDKVRYKGEIKKCIIQFCMDYHLSFSNITYEMLKKSYYRMREKKKEKKCLKMSLNSPLLFLM